MDDACRGSNAISTSIWRTGNHGPDGGMIKFDLDDSSTAC